MPTRNIDLDSALTLVKGKHTVHHSLISNHKVGEQTEDDLDIHEVFFEEDGMVFLYKTRYYVDAEGFIHFLELEDGRVVFHPVKD